MCPKDLNEKVKELQEIEKTLGEEIKIIEDALVGFRNKCRHRIINTKIHKSICGNGIYFGSNSTSIRRKRR